MDNKSSDKNYRGWNSSDHLKTFDLWNLKGDKHFMESYGCFGEFKYLRDLIESEAISNVLDVGCATGTTYRWMSLAGFVPAIRYIGLDLSEPALARARYLHPSGDFRQTSGEPLLTHFSNGIDVVISRDTVMHQTEPLKFIDDLCSVASQALILRLRTRDVGETDFNVETSCQMHYDAYWMPYIVLNIDELIAHLSKNKRVSRIQFNRSYDVLGGKVGRFLPKDLYFTSAGGAETCMIVRFSEGERVAPTVVRDEFLEGHAYIHRHRRRFLAYSVLDRLRQKAFGPRA